MPADWLDKIAGMLDNSMGKNAQRQAAYEAAVAMDEGLPYGTRNGDLFAGLLRRMFEAWVHHMRYLQPAETLEHHLPETMTRSDLDVATEYGLNTSKSIQTKQEWLEKARNRRIERCSAHLALGWEVCMCVSFVCAQDEWRTACGQARVAA